MARTPVLGRVYIDVPAPVPNKGGILAATEAAGTLFTVADGKPELRGFQYETDGNAPVASLDVTDCLKTAQVQALDGLDVVQSGEPFQVYSGYECNLATINMADAEATSERRLIAGETQGVEKDLWTQTFDAAQDITPTPGTAVKPKRALGLAAEWAGRNFVGVPYFHVGRRLAVFLAGENLLDTEDDAAVKGGGVLVNGSGYYGAGPVTGSAALTADKAWLVVTGRVILVRGGIDTFQGVGPKNNNAALISERTYVPAIEGVLGAILVDLT